MSRSDEVLVDDDGAVRVLTLNRPDRLNAFTAVGYRMLADALVAAADDDAVHVVVLRGAGRAFSSGVDLDAVATGGEELGREFDALLDALVRFPKPLLAAVHGAAVGFGLTILLHCDIVYVADDARLRAPFTVLGTAPEAGSSWLLPELVGPQRAAEILLSARWIAAEEAVAMGLAVRRCPVAEVHDDTLALAREIAGHRPAGVVVTKRLLRETREEAVRSALLREREAAGEIGRALGPMRTMQELRQTTPPPGGA